MRCVPIPKGGVRFSPNNLLAYAVYSYSGTVSSLIVAASFYCYRLTRITGAFRAWTLMIAALAVLAFGVLASFVRLVAFESPAQVERTVQQAGAMGFAFQGAYGLTLSALLFLAMFELYGMFRRTQKTKAPSYAPKARLEPD